MARRGAVQRAQLAAGRARLHACLPREVPCVGARLRAAGAERHKQAAIYCGGPGEDIGSRNGTREASVGVRREVAPAKPGRRAQDHQRDTRTSAEGQQWRRAATAEERPAAEERPEPAAKPESAEPAGSAATESGPAAGSGRRRQEQGRARRWRSAGF